MNTRVTPSENAVERYWTRPLPPAPSPKRRGGESPCAPPLRFGEGAGGRGFLEDRRAKATPHRPRQQGCLLDLRQHRTTRPHVITGSLDLAQDAESAAEEQFDVRTQGRRHPLDQRKAAVE